MHLNQWLEEQQKSKAQFSRETGISEATVSRLCRGRVFPSTENLKVVYLTTDGDVTPNDFYHDYIDSSEPDTAA